MTPLQQFGIVTANSWAFTLTGGALLMIVPVAASWPKTLSVIYVMAAQAISGIAKDLNKMSAKGAIRTVVPQTPDEEHKGEAQLFRWVAILTGSKNPLKGVGFFLGGVLLTTLGFSAAVGAMAAGLALAFLLTLVLSGEIGRMKSKPAFAALFSKSTGINVLSLARFFIVRGPRRVVRGGLAGVPVGRPGLEVPGVGRLHGPGVIGYGIVQGAVPTLRHSWGQSQPSGLRRCSSGRLY
jgi:hypothetical protein